MNFANAFHAGGGVTRGASAQEESLCRTSTLYPLLYRNTLRYSYLQTPQGSEYAESIGFSDLYRARAYKAALQEFPKVFTRVEFAVYLPPKGSTNYEVFQRVLGG